MGIFQSLMKQRRSIREYKEKDVPISVIRELIADACEAPSAGNRQPWGFIVISNRELIGRLSEESKKNLLEDMKVIRSPILRMYRPVLKNPDFNVFYNAPCLVYITGPTVVHSVPADCSLAAAYFMFSAAERGLGTCWVDLGAYIKDETLLDEIGLPKDYRIMAPIIVGYPKTIPARPPRNEPRILKIVT